MLMNAKRYCLKLIERHYHARKLMVTFVNIDCERFSLQFLRWFWKEAMILEADSQSVVSKHKNNIFHRLSTPELYILY